MKTALQKYSGGGAEALSRLCALYTAVLFTALPLAADRGYFNITRTKWNVYAVLTLAFLLAAAIILIIKRERPRVDPVTAAFWAFLAPFVLSSLLPFAHESVWLGESNRYQGIAFALLLAAAAPILRRYGRFSSFARMGMTAGFAAVSAVAVLDFLGLDCFGFLAVLRDFDRLRFLSTVGNVDILGAYTVLLLPVCLSFALREGNAFRCAALCGVCILGLWAAMACRCDSAVLGLGAGLLLLPLLLADDERAFRRFPLVLPGGILAAELFALVTRAGGSELSALTEALLAPETAIVLAVLGVSLRLLLRRGETKRTARVYAFILLALLLLAAVFLLLANTVLADALPESVAAYAVIDGDWGSDRGRVWASCLEMFRHAPPVQKLIGGGSGCVIVWDRGNRVFDDAVTDAAHNEYLHYLLTNGILGAAAYAVFLALSAREAWRHGGTARAFFAGCAAYGVQAAVNIAQPITTPLFFTLLLLCGTEDGGAGERERRGRGLFILLLTALLLTLNGAKGARLPAAPAEAANGIVRVTPLPSKLYAHPGETPVASTVSGERVTVIEEQGAWTKVALRGKTYYIPTENIA